MTMQFDGREELDAKEAAREVKTAPVRAPRGKRTSAKAAAKAEALGDGGTFEFDGKTYTVDGLADWDIDVLEMMEEGQVISAGKLLFGDEQWKAFKTDDEGNRLKRTIEDVGEFLSAATGSLGLNPGE